MTLLLLVAFLSVLGTFFAVPLFEFVFGTLLLVPVIRFLLGWGLLQVGYEVPQGAVSVALYVISLALVVGLTYKVFGRRAQKIDKKELYPIAFFGVVFCLAYGLCMQWPDFVDLGERLRDYSMLASSIDSPVVPKEPWMEGIKLNYYVYWYRFGNLLNTVLGMQVWEAYHALVSFSISLYAAIIFQIVRVIIRGGVGISLMAGLFIPFGSNIAGVLCLKRAEKGFGWEADNGWWGPSRVLKGAIDEFPAWSFVLGDAHPHFLNIAVLPFFVLVLYRILASERAVRSRMIQAGLFVVGASLFLKASNAWEVPMWLGTVGCIGLLAAFFFYSSAAACPKACLFKNASTFQIVKGVVGTAVLLAALFGVVRYFDGDSPGSSIILLIVGAGFFALSFPFNLLPAGMFKSLPTVRPSILWTVFWGALFVTLWISGRHIVPPEDIPAKFVRSPTQVTTTAELFMHWGIQLFFLTLGSLLLLRLSAQTVVMAGFLGLALLYDKAAVYLYCIMALQVVRFIADRENGKDLGWARVFEDALIMSGLVLILTPEIVFLDDSYGPEIDRMNTIFKLYTTAWGLLGIGAVSVMTRAFKKHEGQLAQYGSAFPVMIGSVVALVFSVGFWFFYSHTMPMRENGRENPTWAAMREGLGSAERWHPGSAETIRALRKRPKGRVLEAQGRAYSYTGFVATLSAQPSYLGWANHINLLNKEYGEVTRREAATKAIYNESDCAARKELAKGEKLSYIVLGTLERKAYAGSETKDYTCFSSVIKTGEYALYEIPVS